MGPSGVDRYHIGQSPRRQPAGVDAEGGRSAQGGQLQRLPRL